jgi:CDP-2,3-bis-(O-geranylgeranyl)-sn-glycerol synthase
MIILQALYFMLPAYCANMAPVFAAKILGSKFAYPLDFNLKFKGQPLLGKNKTWRGLIAAVLVATVIVYLQKISFYSLLQGFCLIDYSLINVWVWGVLFGLGVILGDAVKSFFKRRANLKPGDKSLPWDQIDFLGALILIHLVYQPSWLIILIIIIISPLLPMAANWIGYKLKLKKVPW